MSAPGVNLGITFFPSSVREEPHVTHPCPKYIIAMTLYAI